VDPYYLTHRAEKAGYHPEVILAGRRINDGVGQRVARECIRHLMRNGSKSKLITVLGLTFKEDVPDIRNSRVVDIIHELHSFGASVQVHDPLASPTDADYEYGIKLTDIDRLEPAEAVIVAVPHQTYLQSGWPLIVSLLREPAGVVMDVKARLDRANIPPGVQLWRL
jgi:UDP-N-acetyl-D-galactosamine dehydrogenase